MMHPSTINNDSINGKTSNLSTTTSYYNYHDQRTTTCFSNFCNYNYNNHEILSKPSQVISQYCHSAIPLELDQPPPPPAIVPDQLFQQQQQLFTINDHAAAVIFAGSNHYKTNMQSSYNINNGKFVAANYDNRVIMNDCSTLLRGRKKKDRHSKINTARGPRDRRMRLSLDVAKRFFRLQDILGFDKASDTIDWLLIKSKPAIQDLILPQHMKYDQGRCSLLMGVSNTSPASSSSASDQGEVVSGGSIDDNQSMDKAADAIIDQDQVMLINNKQAKFSSSSNCSRPSNNNYKKRKQKKFVRKISGVCNIVDHGLAKETREKARARARKRTFEKKSTSIKLAAAAAAAACVDQYYSKLLINGLASSSSSLDQNINNRIAAGSWIPQVQATSADHHQAAEYGYSNDYHHQFKSQAAAGAGAGINNINDGADHNSMISNYWSPSLLFNDQHNNPAAGPPSHNELQHDDQLSDFQQILGKPWELAGGFN